MHCWPMRRRNSYDEYIFTTSEYFSLSVTQLFLSERKYSELGCRLRNSFKIAHFFILWKYYWLVYFRLSYFLIIRNRRRRCHESRAVSLSQLCGMYYINCFLVMLTNKQPNIERFCQSEQSIGAHCIINVIIPLHVFLIPFVLLLPLHYIDRPSVYSSSDMKYFIHLIRLTNRKYDLQPASPDSGARVKFFRYVS